MNTKTNITHQSSQTITQITKRYFSYQLFVIGAVMTKACGGGGTSGEGGASAILINGGAPIATAGIMDVTGADLTDMSGDDTYLIDYAQFSGNLQVLGVGGGYDTVLIQGYSGAGFNPLVTVGFILIKTAGYPDIEFAFPNLDVFERFVFDVGDVDGNGNGDGLINGSDFVWLIGYKNENYEIEGTDVKDYIRGGEGDDTINGFAGDDEIYGRAGDDTINGGDGDDIINGGLGDDIIDGGDGDDTIFYNKGGGNDVIEVGDGNDVLILLGFVEDDIISQRMGDDLKLNFKSTSGGGSIILKNSINSDMAGIDRILFDTNGNGIEDNQEIVWEDHEFEGYLPRLIDGGRPIDTVGRIDMIEEYNKDIGTRADFTNTPEDDTYLIDYRKVISSGVIEFRILGGNIGASGYDTVLVQGYPENNFIDVPFTSNIDLYISHDSNPDITFTFATGNSFERFVFDVDGNGLINGDDFTWLIGNLNVNNEIKGTNVKDYIRAREGNDIIYGYAGNDILNGGQGDDIIYGNDDDDIIYGGVGNDEIYGDAGDDTIYGGTGIDYIYGGLGIDTIEGNEGNDYIYGGAGADTIDGNVGNDYIYGQGGDDTIDGGAGNNKIFYYKGDGNDVLSGDDGVDTLILVEFGTDDILGIEQTGQDLKLNFKPTSGGGSIILKNSVNDDARGIDKIVLDTNADEIEDITDIIWEDNEFERDIAASNIFYIIHRDNGDDEIYGNDEDNIIDGGDGDNYINGGGGDDTISGDDGADTINGNEGDDIIYGGAEIDTIYGGAGDDTIYGEAGNDIIYGGAEIDTIYGGGGDDYIYGGAGNDEIYYEKGHGNDIIDGGAGDDDRLILVGFVVGDILSIERTGQDLKLIFNDSSQGGSIILRDSINDDAAGIDKIVFDTNENGEDTGDIIWEDTASFVDHIAASNIPYTNIIHGTAGADTITGSLGNNRIVYNKGDGDDTIEVGDGVDTLILVGFVEDDVLRIERTGQDLKLIFKDSSRSGSIFLKDSFNDTDAGIDKIVFDTNADGIQNAGDIIWLDDDASFEKNIADSNILYAIYGTAGIDIIAGGGGNDFIYGYAGNDEIYGSAGDDTIDGGVDDDTIRGGDGDDTLYGNDGGDRISGDYGIDTIYGGAGIDIIFGGYGDDIIFGDDGNDIIEGGYGNDIIEGGAGNDTIEGNAGNDTIDGGDGIDTIKGGDGIDTIKGGDGIDTIKGGAGNDTIHGGYGDDIIYGGGGDDIIFGGDGHDELYYNKGEGHDIIYGDDGDDTIEDDYGVDELILVGFVEDDILSLERTGDDLKLIFEESAGGGSIILIDSINNDRRGVDKIVFDTDSNGEDTGDIIWLDEDFETTYLIDYPA